MFDIPGNYRKRITRESKEALIIMIVGIMQPYFYPYLGYFSLIKQVDRFILFDTVQLNTGEGVEK